MFSSVSAAVLRSARRAISPLIRSRSSVRVRFSWVRRVTAASFSMRSALALRMVSSAAVIFCLFSSLARLISLARSSLAAMRSLAATTLACSSRTRASASPLRPSGFPALLRAGSGPSRCAASAFGYPKVSAMLPPAGGSHRWWKRPGFPALCGAFQSRLPPVCGRFLPGRRPQCSPAAAVPARRSPCPRWAAAFLPSSSAVFS